MGAPEKAKQKFDSILSLFAGYRIPETSPQNVELTMNSFSKKSNFFSHLLASEKFHFLVLRFLILKLILRADEMTQRVKELAAKPDHLNLIPGPHMLGGKNQPQQIAL